MLCIERNRMMAQLLEIREIIKTYVGRYENYLKPIGKFVLTLITLLMIKSNIGYASRLGSLPIILIVALMASFMPLNFMPVIAVLFVLLNLYSLSLTCVLVVGILVLVMFLLYFRFSPKDTILLMLTPVLFVMKIPYVIPLVAGLVSAPTAIVSVGCGAVMYYVLKFISMNTDALAGSPVANILTDLKFILDEFMNNKEMVVVVMAFSLTIVAVSIIRRLDVDHAWTVAIVAGTLLDIMVILIGDIKFGTYISVVGLIIGSIVGIGVVIVIKFFAFNVDYSRTEKVMFEDDEYVYYVKAVPKNTIAPTRKKVKKIDKNSSEERHIKHRNVSVEDIGEYEVEEDDNNRPAVKKNKKDNYEIKENSNELSYSPKKDRMTGIERAAAAKARKTREENR